MAVLADLKYEQMNLHEPLDSPSILFAYNNRIENILLGPWSQYDNVHEWTLAQP